MTAPIYNPTQPFMLPITGGLAPGRIAHINGIIAPTATSIVVKLQSGPYGDPNDEVGLCFYGRVAEGVIGLNAFTRAAGWGQEQPFRTPALVKGQPIEISILSDPYVFKIAINRVHLAEYRHVMNPALVNHLNIISTPNDITATYIFVQDPNQPAPPPPMGQPGQPLPQAPGGMYGAPQHPGAVPGYGAPQHPGAVPGYNQPGHHPGSHHSGPGMGSMVGAAAVGAVAGGAIGVAGGMAYARHRSGSSSSSSDDDHGGFFMRSGSPERYDGGSHTTVIHHHHHDSNQDNDEGGDINININIEGDKEEAAEHNVAALTLEDQQAEEKEEEEEEEEASSSSSSEEEEPEEEEEEPEEEEEEPEEEDEE